MASKGLALNAVNFKNKEGKRVRKTSQITNSLEANPSTNTRQLVFQQPTRKNPQQNGKGWKENEAYTIDSTCQQSVLVSQKSTNTPSKSTKATSRTTKTTETQPDLFQKTSQTSTSSAEDSLAKLSLSLGKEADLKILAELCSTKSLGSLGLKDLNYCSWKMSKDFSHTIKGEPLDLSSQPFLTWGIFSNGRYLTARITECRKTGKGCSLSDILEDSVDERYFLSEEQTKKIMSQSFEQTKRITDQGGGKPDSIDSERRSSSAEDIRPVLTPDRPEKRQNGRRVKGGGEPMFTITSQDKHGIFIRDKQNS